MTMMIGNTLGGESGKATSYNGSLATANLDNFRKDMDNIITTFGKAYSEFMDKVREYWASPAAVDASTECKLLESILKSGKVSANGIIVGSVGAIAAMAAGSGGHFSYNGAVTANVPDEVLAKESMDGWYGVDPDAMYNACDAFQGAIDSANNALDALQSSIGAYTPDGSVRNYYEGAIAAMKRQVIYQSTSVKNKIRKEVTDFNQSVDAALNKACAELDAIKSEIVATVNS